MKKAIAVLGIKYGDFVILILLLLLLLVSIVPSRSISVTAEIAVDGETVKTVALNSIDSPYTETFGGCVLLFEKGSVTFYDSDCRDRTCVNYGKMKNDGECMACLPNRVSVRLYSDKAGDFDAVTH